MISNGVLKTPIIFILDELFKISFGMPEFINALMAVFWKHFNRLYYGYDDINIYANSTIVLSQPEKSIYEDLLLNSVRTMVCWSIFTLMLILIALSGNYIRIAYFHIISVFIMVLSGWLNIQLLWEMTIKYKGFEFENFILQWWNEGMTYNATVLLQISEILYTIGRNMTIQLCLSLLFRYVQSCTKNYMDRKITGIYFTVPAVLAFIPCTKHILNTTSVVLSLSPLCKTVLVNIYYTCLEIATTALDYSEDIIKNAGIISFIQHEWIRLDFPSILRYFFIVRMMEQYLKLSMDPTTEPTMYEIVKYLMMNGCDSFLSLLAMISTITYLCCCLDKLFHRVLLKDNDIETHIGVIITMLLYTFTLITGLKNLEPEERFTKLYQLLLIVFAIMPNYYHTSVNRLFGLLHIPRGYSNKRLILASVCIILYSCTMSMCLWWYHQLEPWSFVVYAFNVQTIIRVFKTLIVYALQETDIHSSTSWLKLEDYVYLVRVSGALIDMVVSLFIFMTGIYMKGKNYVTGLTLFLVLFAYSYISVWCKGKHQWKIFNRRRTAIQKINSLPNATEEQLAEYNNYCAICYDVLKTSKVTRCNHLFHGQCLRRWLYVKETCPMCLKKLWD